MKNKIKKDKNLRVQSKSSPNNKYSVVVLGPEPLVTTFTNGFIDLHIPFSISKPTTSNKWASVSETRLKLIKTKSKLPENGMTAVDLREERGQNKMWDFLGFYGGLQSKIGSDFWSGKIYIFI